LKEKILFDKTISPNFHGEIVEETLAVPWGQARHTNQIGASGATYVGGLAGLHFGSFGVKVVIVRV
jgi:hypothetical protein